MDGVVRVGVADQRARGRPAARERGLRPETRGCTPQARVPNVRAPARGYVLVRRLNSQRMRRCCALHTSATTLEEDHFGCAVAADGHDAVEAVRHEVPG